MIDLKGPVDANGRELMATEVCVADELASAAELVMGKDRGIPAAIVPGSRTAGCGRPRCTRKSSSPAR